MTLFIDKYKINSLSQIEYNKHIYLDFYPFFNNRYFKSVNLTNIDYHILNHNIDTIKSINNPRQLYDYLTTSSDKQIYNNMPNLLITGNMGSGKDTFIKLLLRELYGNDVDNIEKIKYSIVGYSNTSIDIMIDQSKYHIVIEPNNSGFDKYVIQEIVKEYAKKYIIPITNNDYKYKIVLINNVDNLSYYAQTSLRCTMEKYYSSCKFILCGKQISKIIDPIRSRCLNIILPNPNNYYIFSILIDIIYRESINITSNDLNYIIQYSNGNIKTAIWLLQLKYYNIELYVINYKLYIQKIIHIIRNLYFNKITINANHIKIIRDILYTVFINNISGSTIIKELLEYLIQYCSDFDNILLQQLINIFSFFEAKIIKGKRAIIHIEAMINSILYHIQKFNNS